MKVTDDMVNRFLGWRLPENFGPDGGVKLDHEYTGKYGMPTGTNLLDSTQARQMLEHVLAEEPVTMFDYLKSHDGPVVQGLEQHETVYAKNQPQYLPLRTLPGENGDSAISRFHLTDAQRKAIAEGADIYLEILHFGGPLAPSRLMVMSEPQTEGTHFCAWWKAQTKGTYAVEAPNAEKENEA